MALNMEIKTCIIAPIFDQLVVHSQSLVLFVVVEVNISISISISRNEVFGTFRLTRFGTKRNRHLYLMRHTYCAE